jgi:hypothetical protein
MAPIVLESQFSAQAVARAALPPDRPAGLDPR